MEVLELLSPPFPFITGVPLSFLQLTFASVSYAGVTRLIYRRLKSHMTLPSIPSLFSPWQIPSPMRSSSIPAFLIQDFLSPTNKCGESTVPKSWVGQKVCPGVYKQTNFLANPVYSKRRSRIGELVCSCQLPYRQHIPNTKYLQKCLIFLSKRHIDSNPGSKRGILFPSLLGNF